MLFGHFAMIKLIDLGFAPEWTLRVIDGQTDPNVDQEAINLGDQKNLSLAVEFEFPYMGSSSPMGKAF